MNDLIFEEKPIPLSEAAQGIPTRRAGRPCNVTTLYRWTTAGCKGVVLESIQIGGTRCTSKEALSRFYRALTVQAKASLGRQKKE